jgi:hypothetical protein
MQKAHPGYFWIPRAGLDPVRGTTTSQQIDKPNKSGHITRSLTYTLYKYTIWRSPLG